jgi:hypothetical protein
MRAIRQQAYEVNRPFGNQTTSQQSNSADPRRRESRDRLTVSGDKSRLIDRVDTASMDSFPCSDPPGYYAISA